MKLARVATAAGDVRVALVEAGGLRLLRRDAAIADLGTLLASDDPAAHARRLAEDSLTAPGECRLLAPIDHQEVWAAGVTYLRSRDARREESQAAGNFYDLVYRADRPELFFKATPHRVVGSGAAIRIRRDARWQVPEPEVTLVLSPAGRIVGYTIGNDMSARDIEGANPLYLPQAKVFDGCCGLGPVVTLADAMPERSSIAITMTIARARREVFKGETTVARMARPFEDLADWLFRESSFPAGVFLLTGTGIVPPDDFSLAPGDRIAIAVSGIGVLENVVEVAAEAGQSKK